MTETTFITVGLLGAYVLLLAGIGWRSRGSAHTVTDFFLADRSLSGWSSALSFNTTAQSRWLLVGLTAAGYWYGVRAVWIVLGEVLGVWLAWVFIAHRFKEVSDRAGAVTVPEWLADRFHGRTSVLRATSAMIILVMAAVYASSQLAAAGYVANRVFGLSFGLGTLLSAVLVAAYVSVGGFRAVVRTDVAQGLILLAVLIAFPVVGLIQAGGITVLIEGIREVDPGLLTLEGPGGATITLLSILSLGGGGLAYLGAPQLLPSFMAVRDQDQLRQGRRVAIISALVYGGGAVITGIVGRFLLPGLGEEDLIFAYGEGILGPVGIGLVVLALFAAIHSTLDSLFLVASSAATRDLYQGLIQPDTTDAQVARAGRLGVWAVAFWAMVFALAQPELVSWLVAFSWSGLASAFVPVVVCSLFSSSMTGRGALYGMISGFSVSVVWGLLIKPDIVDLYEIIPGLLVGFAVVVAVSLRTEPPAGASEELQDVRRAVKGATASPE